MNIKYVFSKILSLLICYLYSINWQSKILSHLVRDLSDGWIIQPRTEYIVKKNTIW